MNNTLTAEPLSPLELDKKRSRVKHCPCGKDNKDGKFVPYVGHEISGYCHSCGETFLPELPKIDEGISRPRPKPLARPQRAVDHIPLAILEKQLVKGAHLYGQNNFVQWLQSEQRGQYSFPESIVNSLIDMYLLGNSGQSKYKGWVMFPYIDIEERLRDIKAMDYNPVTGKRIKEPIPRVLFLGKKILKDSDANTVRCFYGEHLLRGNNKPVKIFESEATATYAAAFYPESVCLATGGSNGCKWTEKDKCKVLKGRHVTLYPDIDAHDKWLKKAETLKSYGLRVKVSELIRNSVRQFAQQKGIEYSELVKYKYDLRDILQYKALR